jgi:hypothetical protein
MNIDSWFPTCHCEGLDRAWASICGICGVQNGTVTGSISIRTFRVIISRRNKRDISRVTSHWGVSLQQLIQWNGISITYSECVSVALGKPNGMRMRHIDICVPSESAVFSTLCHKQQDFRSKSYWTINVCFDFLYNFACNISHSKKEWAGYDHKCILIFM